MSEKNVLLDGSSRYVSGKKLCKKTKLTKKACIKLLQSFAKLCNIVGFSANNDFLRRIEKLIKKNHSFRFFFWEHLLNYKIGFSFDAHDLLITLLSLKREQWCKFEFLFINERENSFLYLELMYKEYIIE